MAVFGNQIKIMEILLCKFNKNNRLQTPPPPAYNTPFKHKIHFLPSPKPSKNKESVSSEQKETSLAAAGQSKLISISPTNLLGNY